MPIPVSWMPPAGRPRAGLMCLAAAGLIIAVSSASCTILRGQKGTAQEDPSGKEDPAIETSAAAETPTPPPDAGDAKPAHKDPGKPTKAATSKPTTRRRRPPLLKKRVLFIGNSYTSDNDLPLMIRKLAEAAHELERITYTRFTVGGCTLAEHWLKTGARLEVRKRMWDYVVLQEQSTRPISQREMMHKYARLFDTQILMAGAKTVFFMTWARQNRPHDQDVLTDAYVSIAKELKAQVAPVGLAWQMALAQRPAIRLHAKDQSHPTRTGTYLAACVFYATFYGKTPLGLPGRLMTTTRSGGPKAIVNLTPQDAMFCQQIAWDAVRRVRGRAR